MAPSVIHDSQCGSLWPVCLKGGCLRSACTRSELLGSSVILRNGAVLCKLHVCMRWTCSHLGLYFLSIPCLQITLRAAKNVGRTFGGRLCGSVSVPDRTSMNFLTRVTRMMHCFLSLLVPEASDIEICISYPYYHSFKFGAVGTHRASISARTAAAARPATRYVGHVGR